MARPFTQFLAFASVALALPFSSLLRAQDTAAPEQAPMAPAPDAPAPGAPAPGAPAPGADTPTGPVQDTISFQTFYDNLAPMGTWVQTKEYGYVWQPNVTDANWAPYTLGHWAYTEDGWTWMSDEAFGWATYHYGRWANLQDVGWVWVPGYVWAPAWVSWRTSDDTVGWAPLPPDSMAGVDYSAAQTQSQPQGQDQGVPDQGVADQGYEIGSDVDEYYGIGPALYVFLPINFLCWHDYHGHWCDHHDNWWRINQTHNVTNTRVARHGAPGVFRHVTVGGPDVNAVNAKSQTPFQQLKLSGTKTPGNGNVNGNTVQLYAPRVGAGTATGAKPQQVGSTLGDLKINRGTDVTQPLVVNSHLAPTLATQEQIAKAREAQSQAPSTAKIMNDGATFGTAPRSTITMMKPIVSHTSTQTFNAPQGGPMVHGQGQVYQQQGQTFAPQQRGLQGVNVLGAEGNSQNNQQQQQQRIYQNNQQVYQQGQPQTHTQQQPQGQFFTPAPNNSFRQQQQQQSSSGGSSGAGAGASHVYSQGGGSSQPVVHQSAPVQSAPSQGSSGGGAESSRGSSSYSGGGGYSSGGGSSGGGGSSSNNSSNNNSSGGSSSGGGGGFGHH